MKKLIDDLRWLYHEKRWLSYMHKYEEHSLDWKKVQRGIKYHSNCMARIIGWPAYVVDDWLGMVWYIINSNN